MRYLHIEMYFVHTKMCYLHTFLQLNLNITVQTKHQKQTIFIALACLFLSAKFFREKRQHEQQIKEVAQPNDTNQSIYGSATNQPINVSLFIVKFPTSLR
jgi:hypothetical protein